MQQEHNDHMNFSGISEVDVLCATRRGPHRVACDGHCQFRAIAHQVSYLRVEPIALSFNYFLDLVDVLRFGEMNRNGLS